MTTSPERFVALLQEAVAGAPAADLLAYRRWEEAAIVLRAQADAVAVLAAYGAAKLALERERTIRLAGSQ